MSDPKKRKKKSAKNKQGEDTKPVNSANGAPDADDKDKSVDEKLQDLEDRYVTRPANVRPPLPEANPSNIGRSGIQKAYNPKDINQFPEESVYAMEPFILDEYRLNPVESEEAEQEDESVTESGATSEPEDIQEEDSWEKTKGEFGGEDAWSRKEKSLDDSEIESPWAVEEKETTSSKEEFDSKKYEDDMRDFSLLGEDSIYELEPIVLDEFGFGKLLNPDTPVNDSELPEVGPDTVSAHTDEEVQKEDENEPFKPEERFPEFSNYEIEPIKIDEQLTNKEGVTAAETDIKDKSQEKWELESQESGVQPAVSESVLEPGSDPLSGHREVATTLHEVTPVVVPDEEDSIEQEQITPEEEEDRGVAKTIHELEPIQVAPQDRLTAPPEEESPLIQPGSDPLVVDERKVETTLMEIEVTKIESPLHEVPSDTVSGANEVQADVNQDSSAESRLLEESIPQSEPEKPRMPLIDLAVDADVSTHVDAIAVESEKAAIAKEIQTQESLSAVRESAIRRTLNETGVRDAAGQTLEDKYLIRGVIGQGGISVVYKAQDLPTGQIVAVKTLKENNPDVAFRFKKEIETLTKLNHNNIVRAIESISSNDGRVYLIMEHIKGISLQELLKQYGRAEHPEIIATILSQVCDGLGHAHEHKIVHRDLKGGNIVLTNVNEKIVIKILDFGIAKLEDDMQRVTHEGKAMGSPLYMSPEQCRGQPLSTRSDIYSLGIVAYELITGELPVKGRSIVSVMAQHCDPNFRPVPMSKVRPELPGVHMLDQIVFKALETDPTKRIQLTDQFKRGIEYWIESVRSRSFTRIIPKELLYSEELEQMTKNPEIDGSVGDIVEARNTAMKTGAKYTDVLSKNIDEKEKNKSFEEVLTSYKGLKSSVVGAAIMIFIAMAICILLIKTLNP